MLNEKMKWMRGTPRRFQSEAWLALLLPVVLSACSLTPPLAQPALPVSNTFEAQGMLVAPRQVASATLPDWQRMFTNPRLQRLITLALGNNRDLRLAVLNAGMVQAQYGITRAASLPAVEASAGATRQRTAEDDRTSPVTPAAVGNQYGLSVGMSAYELDLFGHVRALNAAALARYLASEQGSRAARITLVAAVADAYFAERLADAQQQLAVQTRDDWQHSLALARQLKAADQNSGLDIAQAEGQVASAEADLEARKRAVAQAHNALQLLVGTALPADLPPPMPLSAQPVITTLPAGLPSDLLLRRPDLLQAEQTLQAANADIGAARAAFFPRLSLTASMGYSSQAMDNLFAGQSRVWSFAPQITLPIFQGGRLRAELRLAELRKSGAVAEYERAIQTAFREVADGLAGQATYGRQIAAQTQVVASAQRRTELSALRYRAGVDGRLELLDAQRQFYAAQQALLDLRRSELGNAVTLYKALGGGI